MIPFETLDEEFKEKDYAPEDWKTRFIVYLYAAAIAEAFNGLQMKYTNPPESWTNKLVIKEVMKNDWFDEKWYRNMTANELWLLLVPVVEYILNKEDWDWWV